MFFNPVYNQNSTRPYRWALQAYESGDIMERYWLSEDHFSHWTMKDNGVPRDTFTDFSPYSHGNFTAMRRKTIGFLTTYHRDMYEDGKYTEVYNDPLNYIFDDPENYDDAFPDAEQRIGNYRMGVRRHIIHLGGTISEDELDMFVDKQDPPVALTSFPLMPPAPIDEDYTLPFRTRLTTSDVGYIDYVKTANPGEAAVDQYAYRSEQGTGFRRFIYPAGDTAGNSMIFNTDTITSVSQVKIPDLESLIDAQFSTQIAGSTVAKQFLPIDGEDIVVNFAGQNIIRSDKDGIHLEVYDDINFTTLISLIDIDNTAGEILIGAGATQITITADGAINITAGSNDITMTVGNLDITGGLKVSGKTDLAGDLDVLGITKHGV